VNNVSNLTNLNKREFVIISSIDYSEIHQMPQHLATSLVESGHRVLFVENTGVRAPRFSDASRIGARIQNWFKGTRGFFDVQANLTVYSPLFIPLPYSQIALAINRFMLSSLIDKWMRSSRFYNPILITFLPTPLANALIKDIDPSLVIYYCANDMAGGSVGASSLRKHEDIFFANADAVFCNSNALMEKAEKFAKKSFLFPAGVDFCKFENARKNSDIHADLSNFSKPIVGYIGAISGVFDQELLVKIAHSLPDVNFVLVGPIYVNVSLLELCKNIFLLDKRPHDQIPSFIKGFDVALIPYVKTPFTEAVYSCKLNEYLAMGVPVVATNLRELRLYVDRYGDVLQIAKTHDDFIQMIRLAISAPDKESAVLRINAAKDNSWEKRFEGIYGVISQLVAADDKKPDWKFKLINRYRRSRVRMSKYLFFILISYLLLFYSPLVWFAGNQLAVRHDPKNVDAIVVFSGDGESSYINQSYQRRTLDAIHYFKSGYAPLIILSSGKDQTISEVEIIRSLLINRQVPDQSIKILNKYPRSTFENVEMVKDILINNNIRSILLITSPYHSRRALWVWRKAMPELNVLAPMVIDTPSIRPQWTASLDQIKVIIYEYAAIVYYWCKGWL
jgi:uncharacterized SAM-binding protein YcdF (DUF218 family)/glycosyltransferase involved in cell wall biosynthesis